MLRGWRRWLISVFATLIILWICVGAVATRISRSALSEERAKILLDFSTHEVEFTRDLEAMSRNPLLVARGEGDAAKLMFEHVRWERSNGETPTFIGHEPISPALASAFVRWSAEWTTHEDDPRLDGLDLLWLQALQTYAYWDVEPDGGPLDGVPFGGLESAQPNYADLRAIAKARLLLGLRNGDHVSAGAEVRQLARLAFTTETLMGLSFGGTLLSHERVAWERAVALGRDVSGWTPVSETERQQLFRTAFASVVTRSLVATGAVATKDIGVFQCAALKDGLENAHFLSRYLKQTLRARYEELDDELTRSPCRLRRARLNRLSPDEAGAFPVSVRALCPGGPESISPTCDLPDVSLAWLPFVRLPLGTLMLTDGIRHRIDFYESYRRTRSSIGAPAPMPSSDAGAL